MKNYSSYHGSRKNNVKISKILITLFAVLSIGVAIFCKIYAKSHFLPKTKIQEVDCSLMTVEQAYDAISDMLDNQTFTVVFSNSTHEICGKDIGLRLISPDELTRILEEQQGNWLTMRTYTLKNGIEADHQKIVECLQNLPELQEENMQKPENAYIIVQEDGTLAIQKETLGTEINFENAVLLFEKTISNGGTNVDFGSITNSTPDITSNDAELNQTVTSVNKVLSTVIQYTLADGSTYTLDKEVLKSWVCMDEEEGYYVDFNNIETFVEELNEQVQKTTQPITFYPTGLEKEITLSATIKMRIDIDAEIQLIKEELLNSGTYNRTPMYDKNLLKSYIEVDITRQMVWLYYEGECILETACVTGTQELHDTPTGVYYLTYKTTNTYLRGYNDDGSRYSSFVNFWMPFNGGIGFHDAMWRSNFGGTIYQYSGSHGCVNLPYESAKTIYNHINNLMPIIVYCS